MLWPVACGGCRAPDEVLCRSCAAALRGGGAPAALAGTTVRGAPPTWAACAYEGRVRSAVVAWKDRERTDLGRWLAPSLAASVVAALEQGEHLAPARGPHAGAPRAPVLLVPVPSARGAVARRGRDAVADLAAAAARGLRARGLPVVAAPVLRPARRLQDQSGLDAAGRAGNVERALVVRRGAERLEGRAVVLVDDVVTTGATLADAARALRQHGCAAPVAAVVAAAQRRGGGAPPAGRAAGEVWDWSLPRAPTNVGPWQPDRPPPRRGAEPRAPPAASARGWSPSS